MKERTYHVALLRDYRKRYYNRRVILQLRRNIDNLDCEIWMYLGERVVTKAHVRQHCKMALEWVNKEFGMSFTQIKID